MKTLIISYSYTGNNQALAQRVAEKLGAEHFSLKETKERSNKDIFLDMLFHRPVRFTALPQALEDYDLVLFMGPVWFFGIPAPLRNLFNGLRKQLPAYAWISFSGGSLGPNTSIAKELVRRLGKGLCLCLDLTTAAYCATPRVADLKDAETYILVDHPEELERLSELCSLAIKNLRLKRGTTASWQKKEQGDAQ